MKRKIPVVGMACAACAANVERKLQSIHGVTSASVSLPTRTATVEWDEQAVTPEDMKCEVNAIGFDLVIEGDRRVEELEQREYTLLKRQTLVAWLIAILVMALCGSAIFPLLYAAIADGGATLHTAYWILIPAALYMVFYAFIGHRINQWTKS